jgi:hypothetical protein
MTLAGPNGAIKIPAVRRRLSKAALWRAFMQRERDAGRDLELHRTTFYAILRSLGAHTRAEQGVDNSRVEFSEAASSLLALINRLCQGVHLRLHCASAFSFLCRPWLLLLLSSVRRR